MSLDTELLEAELLEDCARNLRIAYRLPLGVDAALLRAAGATRVIVNRFSARVAGASDHLVGVFDLPGAGGPVRAEAVDRSTRLVVTYGSLAGPARPEAVMAVERGLERAIGAAAAASMARPGNRVGSGRCGP